MTETEWEDLCDRCGGCCDIGGGVACPNLGPDNQCTDYENRYAMGCCVNVTPNNIKFLGRHGGVPSTCAYLRHANGLPPAPGEYRLIPFLMTHPKIQEKFWAREADERKFKGIK